MNEFKLTGGGYSKVPSSERLTFIDFFAGIGGFRRGLELAGHMCVGFCEWDKFATASYTSMHLITEEQRKYLASLPTKQRQKEILKDEYRNGEWYANDIRSVRGEDMPRADLWCAGFPCQDISVAGKQLGFDGNRSSLYFQIIRILKEQKEEDRPEWILLENVKNLLSVNKGWDFARVLFALDEIGYDAEWQVLNSKDFGVPQNRERVFIVGHSRRFSPRKVFPIQGTNREDSVYQLGQLYGTDKEPNPSGGRVYDVNGICPTMGAGHGMSQPQIGLPCFIDMNYGAGIKETKNARTLQARYNKGIGNHSGETSGVAIPVITPDRIEKRQNGRRFKEDGEPMFTLTAQDKHGIAVEVLGGLYTNPSPNYNRGIMEGMSRTLKADSHPSGIAVKIKEATKKGYAEAHEGDSINFSVPNSNTRRGRVGHSVAQTLDTSCNQGIFVQVSDDFSVCAIWYEKYKCYIAIRKLTPKECFRLQGWTDDYFEKAAFVNSDSQLYKQAGNGVTVNVIREIGNRMKKYGLE